MIASLPMYDRASTRGANDRFWQAIREQLGHGPDHLNRREDPHVTWLRPDLLLSQTCGLPYRSDLHGRVHLVGTPDYGVDGCAPGFYRSCIVVRADDPRDSLPPFATSHLARNDIRSQSGWAAIVAEFGRPARDLLRGLRVTDTGSHAASARAVAEGEADFAAIDAVTWEILQRDWDGARKLRVLTRTTPTPGLPYVTNLRNDAEHLRGAIDVAIEALPPEDRDTLMLKALIRLPASEYLRLPLP